MKKTAGVMKGFRGLDVPYALLSMKEKAEGIAILLPGSGYSVQAPLLHYATGIYLNRGFDVLQVNYHYGTKDYEDLTVEELDEVLKADVQKVITHVLDDKSYPQVYLIAKSFGTIALCADFMRDDLKDARLVWLTPLIKEDFLFQAMRDSHNEGLCIFGGEDRHYDKGRFNELKRNPRLQLHVMEGTNHSLEHDFNVIDSISTHREIMEIIEAF